MRSQNCPLTNRWGRDNAYEDHVLAVVAARVACNDFATAADHDLVDIAPDPDVAVADFCTAVLTRSVFRRA